MLKRVPVVLTVVLLATAAVSTVALAGVGVGPSAPNAEVGQYIEPGGGGGGNPDPGGGGGNPDGSLGVNTGDGVSTVGAGGDLAFTGFVLLPLIMVGVLLILGAIALRRRAGDSPAVA